MEPSTAVAVWNRATVWDSSRELHAGDRALGAILYAHGLVMNGGVIHAAETMEKEEFDNAVAGYKFFGLGHVSGVFERAQKELRDPAKNELQEALLDAAYSRIIPEDSFLFSAFERHFLTNPDDFAPIE